jgi:hypothetical protein
MTDDSRAYASNTHMPVPQDVPHGAQPDQRIQLTIRLDPALLELATAAIDLLNQPPGGTTPPVSNSDAVLSAVQAGVATILARIELMSTTITQSVADLTAEVSQDTTVMAGAVTLINGFAAQMQAAVDVALAAGATPAQLQAITDQIAALQASRTPLASAVAANTPAATA